MKKFDVFTALKFNTSTAFQIDTPHQLIGQFTRAESASHLLLSIPGVCVNSSIRGFANILAPRWD